MHKYKAQATRWHPQAAVILTVTLNYCHGTDRPLVPIISIIISQKYILIAALYGLVLIDEVYRNMTFY